MRDTIYAAIIVMGMMFSFTAIVISVGPFVDQFDYVISEKLAFEGTPTFVEGAALGHKMFNWFYRIPAFMSFVFFVWMFKVVVLKHTYTREDTPNDYRV